LPRKYTNFKRKSLLQTGVNSQDKPGCRTAGFSAGPQLYDQYKNVWMKTGQLSDQAVRFCWKGSVHPISYAEPVNIRCLYSRLHNQPQERFLPYQMPSLLGEYEKSGPKPTKKTGSCAGNRVKFAIYKPKSAIHESLLYGYNRQFMFAPLTNVSKK
jgi:hypothetical protein